MRLLILGILLAIPAFFSAGEVALLRLRPIKVQRLIEDGERGAQAINRLQRRLRRALIASQLGSTLSLVSLGWFTRGLSNRWLNEQTASRGFLDAALFLVIVLLAILLSGLIPKALVLNRPEVAALRLSPLLEAVMKTLSPLLGLIEGITSLLLRLIGLNTQWDALIPALSAEELETLIETGGVTGLRPDEKNILEGVFALRDTQVREVMIPRSGMVTLSSEVVFSELLKQVTLTRHARFPVIGKSLDDVLGVIDLRQLVEPISKGTIKADTALAPFIQPAPTVLETNTLAELLVQIRSGNPLLLVIDEHGGTEGLVTAADLTGEIVGEESQQEQLENYLQPIEGQPNTWVVAGSLEIIELNRQLHLELPESDLHHTLAGFLLEKLQHVPTNMESLIYEGIRFEITKMHGPRIERVKLTLSNEQIHQGD